MRFGVAILLSVLFHATLAAALALYVEYAPAPDVRAQLDLTSVELSFAETEDETAAVQPARASAPDGPVPDVPPPEPERPPEIAPPPELPPEPDAPKLPEPQPARPPLETPKVAPPKEEPPPRPPVLASAPAPAVAPRQARVDAPPRPRKSIRPDYPKGSRLRGEQGDVLLEIGVAAQGTVSHVAVVASSGFPELDESAVKAARAARFHPARAGGQAISSTVRLTLKFRLR